MINLAKEMKMEYQVNAHEATLLRKDEVKLTKRARKCRTLGSNGLFRVEAERIDAYNERMLLRKEQRYLHLARALLKGTPYKVVETTTREGNEPNLNELTDTIEYWTGIRGLFGTVEGWIKQ